LLIIFIELVKFIYIDDVIFDFYSIKLHI